MAGSSGSGFFSNNSNIMGTSHAVSGVASLIGGYAQAEAMRAQADYQRQMSEINMRLALVQAEDAIKRGQQEANLIRRKAQRTIGTQKAALAANGVALEEGSAAQLMNETADLAAEDITRVTTDAYRQAWGFQVEAINTGAQARMNAIGARSQASNTMLSSTLQGLTSGMQAGYYFRGGKDSEK